jgi:hypothetical protein
MRETYIKKRLFSASITFITTGNILPNYGLRETLLLRSESRDVSGEGLRLGSCRIQWGVRCISRGKDFVSRAELGQKS